MVVVIKVLFILVGAGLVLGGFFAPAGRLGFGGPETTLFALVGSMVDMINIDKIAVPPALVAMKIPLIVASVAAAGGAVLTMVLGLFGFLRSSLVPAVVTLAGVAFLIYRLYGGEGFLIEVPESWAWALLFAGALLAIMTAVSAMFGSYRAQKVRQRTEPAVGRAPRDRGPHFAEPALAAATASSVPPANVPPAKPAAPAKAAPPAHTIAAMGGTAGGTAGAGMGDAPLRADKPSPRENIPPPHMHSPAPRAAATPQAQAPAQPRVAAPPPPANPAPARKSGNGAAPPLKSAAPPVSPPFREREDPTAGSGWVLSGFDANGMAIRINIAEVDLRNHPGGLIIGRSAKSAMLIVRDDSVSRRHAAITQGEPLWLEDIGSSNGTRVNGVALVPNQKVMVTQGAEIEIGAVRLTLTRM